MKINPVQLYQLYRTELDRSRRQSAPQKNLISDRIEISDEAKKMYDFVSQVDLAVKVIEKVPDVREDKIAEVKKKIKENFYNNPEIYREVAKRLF